LSQRGVDQGGSRGVYDEAKRFAEAMTMAYHGYHGIDTKIVRIFNDPREMTIKQFADEIIRITGTKSKIEYKPLPVDDPKVRQPDITRARKVLGWEPRVEFDEGIAKTIEYFKGCLERGELGEREPTE